jgi:hypothetical protein
VVFEHLLTNLHGHSTLRSAIHHGKRSLSDLENIYTREWQRRVPSGTLHIERADSTTRSETLDYMKKEWRRPGFFNDMLVL